MYFNRNYIWLIAFIIIGFSSCYTHQLAEAPKIDTQGLVREGEANKGDTTTIANIPWKNYFTDPKLQALIEEGISKNIDMQIAIIRINEAEVNLTMAKAANLPTLSAIAQIDHTRTSTGSRGTDVFGYTSNVNMLGFSASWEVDLWGKLNSQTKVKYASYLNSCEYKNLVQTALIANIAKAYYSLVALDEQLRITKESIVLLEKTAKTMADLKTAGQQNAAAVEQSNALLYGTQLSIPQLQAAIRQQENAICLLLDRKPSPVDRTSINVQSVSTNLNYGIPLQMLSKRSDVKQAELSLRSAYALTDVAQANLYPSLTLSGSLGLAAGGFVNFFNPKNLAAEIIAGLTQPIFYKKQLTGNLKIAQAQQQESLLTFQNTVLAAGLEVSDILYSYQASLGKNEFRDKQVQSLGNAVSFTQDLLLAGEATYTEVLSAQQSLLSAQLNKVDDKLEQLTYSVSLYKALGGGVQ